MSEKHVVSWTPVEAWVFAEMTRVGLVASLDDGPPRRAARFEEASTFSAQIEATDDETSVAIRFDADRATLALEPLPLDGNPWRDAWTVVLVREQPTPDENEYWSLTPGERPAEIEDARRGRFVARLRVRARAIHGTLDGVENTLPLTEAAFYRYTWQSSAIAREGPLAWAAPTREEPSPWWQIDLGDSRPTSPSPASGSRASASTRSAISTP